jgi:hypothetical protein
MQFGYKILYLVYIAILYWIWTLVYNNTTNIDIFLACELYKLHDINLITNELFSL